MRPRFSELKVNELIAADVQKAGGQQADGVAGITQNRRDGGHQRPFPTYPLSNSAAKPRGERDVPCLENVSPPSGKKILSIL